MFPLVGTTSVHWPATVSGSDPLFLAVNDLLLSRGGLQPWYVNPTKMFLNRNAMFDGVDLSTFGRRFETGARHSVAKAAALVTGSQL